MIIDDLIQDELRRINKIPKAERPDTSRMLKASLINGLVGLVGTGYISADEITAAFLRDLPKRH